MSSRLSMLREMHEKNMDHNVAHSKLSRGRFAAKSSASKEVVPEIIMAAIKPETVLAEPKVDEEKLDAIVAEEPMTEEVNSLKVIETLEVEAAAEVIVEKVQPEVDVVTPPPVEVVSKKLKGKKTV